MWHCYNVTMLQLHRYNVTSLQYYSVATFQCYTVTVWQCYHVTLFPVCELELLPTSRKRTSNCVELPLDHFPQASVCVVPWKEDELFLLCVEFTGFLFEVSVLWTEVNRSVDSSNPWQDVNSFRDFWSTFVPYQLTYNWFTDLRCRCEVETARTTRPHILRMKKIKSLILHTHGCLSR